MNDRPLLFPLAILILLWPSSAYAYLDPATGSVIVQGLVAGLAAVVVAARLYWARIKGLFRRSEAATDSLSDEEPLSNGPPPTDDPRS